MPPKTYFLMPFFLSINGIALAAPEWFCLDGKDAQTVFYQGMCNSVTQGARYTGSHGFTADTGEHVVNPAGIDTIKNLYGKPEIDEVVPATTAHLHYSDLTINPIIIACALWKSSWHMGTRLALKYWGTQVIPNNNQPSAQTIAAYSLDIGKINIAQEGDIVNFKRRFTACHTDHPQDSVVVYGTSRGAATTFNGLAQLAKEKQDLSQVKLCVLEGCFDDVSHVMKKRHPWLLGTENRLHAMATIASRMISFKEDGPAPLTMIKDFPKNIPVVFITSATDSAVHPECTKNLARKLLEKGHNEVYFLELKKSSHPSYAFDDEADKTAYQNLMHALYKHYKLPYIPEYAKAGEDLIVSCKKTSASQI